MKYTKSSLKNTQTLTGASLLTALNVALGYVYVPITANLKITATFLAAGACGFLYGPFVAGMCGIAADILKYLLNPQGPFMFSFVAIECLGGVLYGLVLHNKKVSYLRALAAKGTVSLICNLGLTPLALSMLYGKGIWAYISVRIVKNVLLWPVESLALYFVLRQLQKIREKP